MAIVHAGYVMMVICEKNKNILNYLGNLLKM